ncbi:MAG TPA: hypothetical protein VLV83_21680 [Acidobacteriota bacterium]|nr:hypothetical protein [Acidobacteriota bacterium]
MLGKKSVYKVFLGLFVLSCVGTNVMLLRQNQELREYIFPDYSRLDLPEEGSRLTPFSASALDGGRIVFSFEEPAADHIFLYFSPSCRFSQEQLPFWRRLVEDNQHFQIVGLVPDDQDPAEVEALLQEHGISGLRTVLISDSWRDRFKLNLSPMTLAVTPDGVVRKRWLGRWGFRSMQEAYDLAREGWPLF